MLKKVESLLQETVAKPSGREKTMILVFYYRLCKNNKENQPKKDEKSLKDFPTSNSLCLLEAKDITIFAVSPDKVL